jgi:short-subunit dehydrogenase
MSSSEPISGGPRRLALVTGASAGIGRAYAERLAREAYDLILVARRRERLEELAGRLGPAHGRQVDVLAADLTESDGLAAVEERIAKEPTLDLLVNNAGFGTAGDFVGLDPDGEERQIRLNVVALVRLTQAALRAFTSRGHGSIVNVSSLAGFQPAPYNATYGGTKAFVNSFTQAVSEELRGSAVRLQLLCPGFTRTEFQEVAGVPTEGIPDFAWMSAESVVNESLAALKRGDLLCIPGRANRVMGSFLRVMPEAVVRRAYGAVFRRNLR